MVPVEATAATVVKDAREQRNNQSSAAEEMLEQQRTLQGVSRQGDREEPLQTTIPAY
jgi:hypothetical protein